MRYRVSHQTRYDYSEPVTLCHNEVRMTPATAGGQHCERCDIVIEPEPSVRHERVDYFGNRVVYFDVEQPHAHLSVRVSSEVATIDAQLLLGAAAPWEIVRDRALGADADARERRLFLYPSPLVPASAVLRRYAAPSFAPGRDIGDAVRDLMHRIHADFTYDPSATTLATPLSRVMRQRRGVCQDFAHVAVGCLRALGLPAAYVSGYLETAPPPGQPRLRGADASHAWASVHVPDWGWVDFDPTNDQFPNERYVHVARGRDYADVTPLRGIVFGGGTMSLSVGVDVEPLP